MCVSLQFAGAQPFARHFWLNKESVNYTLSPPTSKGEWILAAARTERHADGSIGAKNTIAVFRLDKDYKILPSVIDPCSEDVSVIGIPKTEDTTVFDPYMDFVIHSVVEVVGSYGGKYVLCGSVRNTKDGTTAKPAGIVAVLGANLELLGMHKYNQASVFYSVYAKDSFYYVCGQMQDGRGIVLRDSLTAPTPNWSSTTWETTFPWAFHKIVPNNHPFLPEISVSGTDGVDRIGWSVFLTLPGAFTYWNGQYFKAQYPIDPMSKVTLAYYPPASSNPGSTSLLLSASTGQPTVPGAQTVLHTYFCGNNQQQTINSYFTIDWNGRLEDMDCGGDKVAWVGNRLMSSTQPRRTADYIHISYPAIPPMAPMISFFPSNQTDYSAFYSLHKVHYFPNPLPYADNEFHAGGYYNNYSNTIDHPVDRTTLVVTPERLFNGDDDKFPCAERKELDIKEYPKLQTLSYPMYRLYTNGTRQLRLTQRYSFCTMDCEGNKIINL